MILLLLNLLMAVSYALLVGFTLPNFIFGMILSFFILTFLPQLPRPSALHLPRLTSGRKLFQFGKNLVVFLGDFLWDLTVSNLQIAWDVLTPTDYYTPRLVNVPVGDLSPFELTLLSSRITLTPGTLSADVTADRQFLIVHVMYPGGDDIASRLRKPIDILKKGLAN